VKHLIQLIRPEEQARAAALEAGELDLAWSLNPDLAKSFVGRRGFKVVYPPAYGFTILFNTRTDRGVDGAPNPFRDIRVRKAMNMAIDVDTIIKTTLTGKEQPSYGFGRRTFGHPAEALDAKRFRYDPAQAKALLAQAGYPNGFPTTLYGYQGHLPSADATLPIVANYLTQVGVKTELTILPVQNALAELTKFTTPGLFPFATADGEPNTQLQIMVHSKGPYSVGHYPELNVDAMIDKQH